MKAAVLEGINQPIVYKEVPNLQPGPGEAVVQVMAAALNHRDAWIQLGRYAGLKFPIIVGSDGAGIVQAVGRAEDEPWLGRAVLLNPGEGWGDNPRAQSRDYRILGLPEDGTLAEQVKVSVANLHLKPAHLTWEQAAALPLTGLTAYRALIIRGRLRAADRVLITGIGGGVALFGLQLAVAAGAQVYVTSSSEEKIERAKTLGAVGGVNYSQSDWAKRLKGLAGSFDLILDSAGGDGFAELIDLAAPGGRITLVGATRGNPAGIDLRRIFWKQLDLLGSTMGTAEDFAGMIQLVESQQIAPIVDQVFPLAEAEAAFQRMHAGGQFGKIVLRITE